MTIFPRVISVVFILSYIKDFRIKFANTALKIKAILVCFRKRLNKPILTASVAKQAAIRANDPKIEEIIIRILCQSNDGGSFTCFTQKRHETLKSEKNLYFKKLLEIDKQKSFLILVNLKVFEKAVTGCIN